MTSVARLQFTPGSTAPGSRARAGRMVTAHAVVDTPAFMPVGTRGTVRTVAPRQLDLLGATMLLANTYHLMLRPGLDVLAAAGGLRRFMGWQGGILTDSGGFQLYSLAAACAIDDDGASVRPHADGPALRLTPELVIAAQRTIGSDIMMVLDHCVDATSPEPIARAAMERTHRWAARALVERARIAPTQALFAIVQGAGDEALRRHSASHLTALDGWDGFAIGGLAVGEPRAQREDLTELVAAMLPAHRPRYLMGVGTPLDLLEAVHRGVDLFDCILPTALAQQGVAFTSSGRIALRRTVHRLAERPLDDRCGCEACAGASRGYLHHLIKSGEPVGWQLVAIHNLRFYLGLMSEIRTELAAGTFAAYHARRRVELAARDVDNPPGRPPRRKRRG
jgi:queuine tRNA-ribosyltransferase